MEPTWNELKRRTTSRSQFSVAMSHLMYVFPFLEIETMRSLFQFVITAIGVLSFIFLILTAIVHMDKRIVLYEVRLFLFYF